MILGLEAAVWPLAIHLVADWIQGDYDLGVSVSGLVFYPYHHFLVSFGWQIPNDFANHKALVFELTWVP